MHQSLRGVRSISWAERSNVLLQLNVYLCCVWYYFTWLAAIIWNNTSSNAGFLIPRLEYFNTANQAPQHAVHIGRTPTVCMYIFQHNKNDRLGLYHALLLYQELLITTSI